MNILKFLVPFFILSALANGQDLASKINFESKTGFFLFDWGADKALKDEEDIFVDMLALCNGQRIPNVPKKPDFSNIDDYLSSKEAKKFSQSSSIAYKRISKYLKIDSINLKSNVIWAHGDPIFKTTFLIFPDFHQHHLSQLKEHWPSRVEKGTYLHVSQAYDFFNLSETLIEQKFSPIYLIEGVSEKYEYIYDSNVQTKSFRQMRLEFMIENFPEDISMDLGEVYHGVYPTEFVGNKNLFLEWLTLVLLKSVLENVDSPSWKLVKEKAVAMYGFDEVTLKDLEGKYKKISSFTLKEAKDESFNLCDQRSYAMYLRSMSHLKNSDANVAIVRIGASHVGGFIEKLKKNDHAFIIFSPNFP